MNETVTENKGIESLGTTQAAEKIYGLMNDNQEASQDQPQEQSAETNEVETPVAEVVEEEVVAEEQQETEATDDNETIEEEAPEVQTFSVKAEGKEHQVTLEDLVKNYQLEANVRKKMETLAHEKKEIDGIKTDLQSKVKDLDQVTKTRQEYDARLQQIDQFLSQQKEDLTGLKESDPVAYVTKLAEQQEREKQQQQIHAERVRLAQEQQLQNQRLMEERLKVERVRIKERVPELANPETASKYQNELRDFAKTYFGFTDEEIPVAIFQHDSRYAQMLHESYQFKKLQKTIPSSIKKVNKAPKMIKAGVSQPRDDKRIRVNKLKDRARHTGKIKDVAAVLEKII
tara:strand:+ start:552 stop:1583 length:1032 start_codon:yes stop_codon:yes gene_type:complete